MNSIYLLVSRLYRNPSGPVNITNLYPPGRPPPLWVQAYVSAPNHMSSEVLDVNEPIPFRFGWKPLK